MSQKSKAFKWENIKPVAILAIICIVVAALLAGIHMMTKNKIKQQEEEAANAAMAIVLPGAKGFKDITNTLTDEYPSEITAAYTADKGYVFKVAVRGKNDMVVMCGVSSDGKIAGVEIISESETPGYKEKIFPLVTGTDGKYSGMSSSTLEPELVSGATLSSTAIYTAVRASLNAYAVATGGESAGDGEVEAPSAPEPIAPLKTDEELIALSKALVSGSESFSEVYLWQKPYNLVKLLLESSGKGYVAYLITLGWGGSIANEALVHITADGEIGAINHLQCNMGHDVSLDGFAEGFVGSDYWNVEDIGLVTGATGTSGDLKNAIIDAMRVVAGLSLKSEEKLLELMARSFSATTGFEKIAIPEGASDTLRALYREKLGQGYVAYIVTIGSHSKAPESEVIVYFNNEGVVTDAEILVWTVGHGTTPGDFAERLKGVSAETADGDVELVTGSTGTSSNILSAVISAAEVVPTHFPVYRLIGILVAALSVVSFVAVLVITRKRRPVK